MKWNQTLGGGDVSQRFSVEVRSALDADRPVVALESSVIAQGLPWPTNAEAALEVEDAVRRAGAVPATIALIDGVICIGLAREQIERLATARDVFKASPRDLPWLMERRATAATTVAGTIYIAYRAGIRVMATGGIGGVHRDADQTGDVSADLLELARTPIAVVCSGAKSILDLPRTLEYLETHGVPLLGFGVSELPAFFARSSGLPIDCSVDSADQAAAVIRHAGALGLERSILVANPVPAAHALPREEVDRAVDAALAGAAARGVRGKSLTPFLLAHMRQSLGDGAVAANRALLVSNARLAAQIAAAM